MRLYASITVRMMSAAKHLPDQDELQASQSEGPPLKAEARQRPYLWSAEELVLGEECDTSFETRSEKEEKSQKRLPLGLTGSNGSIDPHSQVAPTRIQGLVDAASRVEEEERPQGLITHTYSLPPDFPEDMDQDEGLTDADRLRLAAVSLNISSNTTHLANIHASIGKLRSLHYGNTISFTYTNNLRPPFAPEETSKPITEA